MNPFERRAGRRAQAKLRWILAHGESVLGFDRGELANPADSAGRPWRVECIATTRALYVCSRAGVTPIPFDSITAIWAPGGPFWSNHVKLAFQDDRGGQLLHLMFPRAHRKSFQDLLWNSVTPDAHDGTREM